MIDVSVVVAVYNGEKYLSTLIDSILASGLQNIEVILVNDGSKDASEALCISYVEKDARVKYYSKKNSGIADTRNFGLMYAKGKYVCFMDQDDYIENHGLQRLYEVCEKYSCDFCSANLFYWDGINKIEHIVIENEGLLSDIQRKDLCKYIIGGTKVQRKDTSLKMPGAVWTCLFQKDFLNRHNLRYKSYVDYEDDLVFLANSLLYAKRVYLLKDSFYYWRYGHISESRRIKWIPDFYKKRLQYRKYVTETLALVSENDKEYEEFINYFDGYTVWKTIENEMIHGCKITDLQSKKFLDALVNESLRTDNVDNILAQFSGYKKLVIKRAYKKDWLLVYGILYIKLMYVRSLRKLQNYRWFLKLHKDIMKI